ncbi:hypothetical protein [Trichothermofontia sp.]
MLKTLPFALTATVVAGAIALPNLAQAEDYSNYVYSRPTARSGDRIYLQVVNYSHKKVDFEVPPFIGPTTLQPGAQRTVSLRLRETDHGLSLLYWNPDNFPVRARLQQAAGSKHYRVTLTSTGFLQDDRALYDTEFSNFLRIF